MSVGRVIFSISLGLLLASGTPLTGPAKSLSLPLHRPFSPYESEHSQGALPVTVVNNIKSLLYTIDVQVGSQRFNLTLDTNAQASVLFAKGFAAAKKPCSTGDAQRNWFDPSVSQSFKEIAGYIDGSFLYEYPYIGLECQQAISDDQTFDGVPGQDTYQFGDVLVEEVPFILANHTSYPLNPRWASDGILALCTASDICRGALDKIFDAFGGRQEVSLFLNNASPSDNQPVPGGSITFGGKNTQDCSDKWVTLQADVYWGLPLNSFIVGSRGITSGDSARLSLSSSFLKVPRWFFRNVVNSMGGTFNNDLDLYTVDCSKIHSLPPIFVSLGSGFALTYEVKAQDYVAKMNGMNGVQCALLIVQGNAGFWEVGTQFLPKRCMHLDCATTQIGFADPKI